MDCLARGMEDTLPLFTFPKHYHKRLRTTNLAERMDEEIRCRQRVIRVFPNNTWALRLIRNRW
jgi:putative transposase